MCCEKDVRFEMELHFVTLDFKSSIHEGPLNCQSSLESTHMGTFPPKPRLKVGSDVVF